MQIYKIINYLGVISVATRLLFLHREAHHLNAYNTILLPTLDLNEKSSESKSDVLTNSTSG